MGRARAHGAIDVPEPDFRARLREAVRPEFSVHLLTASGAALAFLALLAAIRESWSAMFLWIGLSLFVDGIDGAIARRLRVAERLPRWSGEVLDLVVDFVTYVFVPAYAIAHAGVVPDGLATAAGLAVVVTGALYFADRRMKTDDSYFRGFPATWSPVAFYLILLRPDPWIGAIAVATLSVATFAPLTFVHPFRVTRLRSLTVAALALWSMLALLAIWQDMKPAAWVTVALCVIAVYFLCSGLWRRPDPAREGEQG